MSILAPAAEHAQLLAHTSQQPLSLFDISINVKLWHWALVILLSAAAKVVIAARIDGRREMRERRAR